MHVAHDLLEREEHGGDRRVECRRQGGRSANGKKPANVSCAQAEPARDDRRDPGADVNGWPFATESDTAGERGRAAYEFADDRTQRDPAVLDEDRGASLWNSATARVRKESVEEETRSERTENRNDDPPPTRTIGRIHVRREAAREQNESDDD